MSSTLSSQELLRRYRDELLAERTRRTVLREEVPRISSSLPDFVKAAWPILEPVTELQWNWHLDLICEHLTLIRDGKFKSVFGEHIEGVIFNVPPRTMKSLLITVFFPAWLWTTQPSWRLMCASYSDALSTNHSVLRRNVIDSPWYQKRWGKIVQFAKDQNLKTHYENTARGLMFATAMRSSATGFGGSCLIFDDALNPDQALSEVERLAVNTRFDTTFRSRLNDPAKGIKIIVMQRLHELDLTGHVLSKEKDAWVTVSLPAIAEQDEVIEFPISKRRVERKAGELLWAQRLPMPTLQGLKRGLGSWAFSGQYQQRPAPLEGGLIKRSWIKLYKTLPAKFDFVCSSWDATFKESEDSDFVAGQVWGMIGADFYMFPYYVFERMDFGPTKDAIKVTHARFPQAHATLIEDKANGPAIISELRRVLTGLIPIEPEGGKIVRGQAMAPLWEAGNVFLPDPQYFNGSDIDHPAVPWLADYIQIICTFPKCAYDDPFDSTSQALIYMRNHGSFGLMEYWRHQAEAQKTATAAKPPESAEALFEFQATRQMDQAVRENIQLGSFSKPKPLTSAQQKLLDAINGHENGNGAKPVCPECGNANLSRVGELVRCVPCGWSKRQAT